MIIMTRKNLGRYLDGFVKGVMKKEFIGKHVREIKSKRLLRITKIEVYGQGDGYFGFWVADESSGYEHMIGLPKEYEIL